MKRSINKFEGNVNIVVDSNGNKNFYEINKIEEVDDILGTSLNCSSTSSINNSIEPTKEDVNTTNKYSMQENEDNTQNNKVNNKMENYNSTMKDYFRVILF